jgi:glycerophosphoryl diester phosphodiesterase
MFPLVLIKKRFLIQAFVSPKSLSMYFLRLIAMFSFLPFFACKTVISKAPIAPPKDFDWQGHRGARGLMPENTVPAFLAALAYPQVSTLELDLAVSKDNQLIVSHEPWFNPIICMTPNGDTIHRKEGEKYLIYQLTVQEIRGFDCGMLSNPRFPLQQKKAAYKPTLREVVEAVKAHDPERFKTLRWNIEIKSNPDWDGTRHPPIEAYSTLVVKTLRDLGIDRNCNVQSFDLRPLQIINRMAPDIPLAYLIENIQSFEANLKTLGFLPAIYSPYYLRVSKKLIKNCHKRNMKIIPWTVNDVGSMRQLIRMGVDGIITDYPNLIQNVHASK